MFFQTKSNKWIHWILGYVESEVESSSYIFFQQNQIMGYKDTRDTQDTLGYIESDVESSYCTFFKKQVKGYTGYFGVYNPM